jgi:hypothetical protein
MHVRSVADAPTYSLVVYADISLFNSHGCLIFRSHYMYVCVFLSKPVACRKGAGCESGLCVKTIALVAPCW